MLIATFHDSVPIFLFAFLGVFLCAAPVFWARWTLSGTRRYLIAAAVLTAVLAIGLVAGEQPAAWLLLPTGAVVVAFLARRHLGVWGRRATAALIVVAGLPLYAITRLRAADRLRGDRVRPRRVRVPALESGRGESNPHLWLGKPASWPLDNARGSAAVYRPATGVVQEDPPRPGRSWIEPGAARTRREYARISEVSGGDPAKCPRLSWTWRGSWTRPLTLSACDRASTGPSRSPPRRSSRC